LADALADRGIGLTTVDPGPTDTGWAPPDLAAELARAFPRGRWTTPDEIAALVAWLVGEDAFAVTGTVIDAEAGFRRHAPGPPSARRPERSWQPPPDPWRGRTGAIRWADDDVHRPPPLARRQPPGAHHRRHGRDRSLLPRCARRPAGGHDRDGRLPPLLLQDRHGQHRGLFRVPRAAPGPLRQAGRGPRSPGHPVRPPVARPGRRGGAGGAAGAAQGVRLRGDRRDRPRVCAGDILHT